MSTIEHCDITEQHLDERIAWRTTDKPHQAGVVTFHRLDERGHIRREVRPETQAAPIGTPSAAGRAGYVEFSMPGGTPTT
ncbi:hypothetical protein [Nonomuraea sp. 10N515B]|uniref:hypothetical protein n=1 Tax=Nonomuraea sp. 10N515B TaxID=3457422 RepID=UPI003FCEAB73